MIHIKDVLNNLANLTKNIVTGKIVSKISNESLVNINAYIKISDDSIIDISKESCNIEIGKHTSKTKPQFDIPYWSHMYVYSYSDLKYASKQQKEFYYYFRDCFLNEKQIDIQENTNYAFILYFDLLNEYKNHRNIKLLEKQFKLLGECCPKTKRYSLSTLMQLMRENGDSYSLARLNELQEPIHHYEQGFSAYSPDAYKLGKLYQDKLGLNKQEVAWLNKFWNPSNVFLSIQGCCTNTIMFYLQVIKALNKSLNKKDSSLAKEVDYFIKQIKKINKSNYDSYLSYFNNGYLSSQAESQIYLTIFKRVENSVREAFGHKRKVSGDFPYSNSLNHEFETRLGNVVNEIISGLKSNIEKPDIPTQIELNAQNVNRWKDEFSELIELFSEQDLNKFIDGISRLEEVNQRNPNIENIFFKASRFIAKYDNVLALQYYAKYIYYDIKSIKFDNRQLTNTIQKSLFKTEVQIHEYKTIIDELISDSDIQKALSKIPNIYVPKRRKIVLDKDEIKDAEQKHNGTVELLNEYLKSDDEMVKESKSHNEKSEGNEVDLTININTKIESLFNPALNMNEIQEQVIKRIAESSFVIHQVEIEKIAIQNGLLKNQLIDSINEICFEILDGEALIEEDEENYIIEEYYYNLIVK